MASGPIPLSIGLVGDVCAPGPAIDGWQRTVAAFIDGLQRRFPSSPVCLLTSQACVAAGIAERLAPGGWMTAPGEDAEAKAAWLCRYSHFMIDLQMSGDDPVSQAAIRYRVESIPPHLGARTSPLFATEVGPIWHLDSSGQNIKLPELLVQVFRDIDAFNARAASSQADPSRPMPWQGELALAGHDALWGSTFALADSMAEFHQHRFRWQALGIGVMAALMAGVLQLGFLSRWAFVAFPVLFFMVGLLYAWARKTRFSEHHKEYRVLAEGIRVQLFWRLAGIDDAVSDQYLDKHTAHIGWIREALRSMTMVPASHRVPLECIAGPWLASQRRYLFESARRANIRAEWLWWATPAFYLLGFIGFVAFEGSPALLEISLFLPSLGTLLLIYLGWAGYRGKASQHARLAGIFEQGIVLLTTTERPLPTHEKLELLRDLGIEAVRHHGEWATS